MAQRLGTKVKISTTAGGKAGATIRQCDRGKRNGLDQRVIEVVTAPVVHRVDHPLDGQQVALPDYKRSPALATRRRRQRLTRTARLRHNGAAMVAPLVSRDNRL